MPKKRKQLEELGRITDKTIRNGTKEILDKYPDYFDQPASVSGKYHSGDTRLTHIQKALYIIKLICEEFQIVGIHRDKLISAMILHDIGYVLILKKGNIPGLKYYDTTGWSTGDQYEHPKMGFTIVMDSNIPYSHKVDIANMVFRHMSHWYHNAPLPKTEDEEWIALADYLSSRSDLKFLGIGD